LTTTALAHIQLCNGRSKIVDSRLVLAVKSWYSCSEVGVHVGGVNTLRAGLLTYCT